MRQYHVTIYRIFCTRNAPRCWRISRSAPKPFQLCFDPFFSNLFPTFSHFSCIFRPKTTDYFFFSLLFFLFRSTIFSSFFLRKMGKESPLNWRNSLFFWDKKWQKKAKTMGFLGCIRLWILSSGGLLKSSESAKIEFFRFTEFSGKVCVFGFFEVQNWHFFYFEMGVSRKAPRHWKCVSGKKSFGAFFEKILKKSFECVEKITPALKKRQWKFCWRISRYFIFLNQKNCQDTEGAPTNFLLTRKVVPWRIFWCFKKFSKNSNFLCFYHLSLSLLNFNNQNYLWIIKNEALSGAGAFLDDWRNFGAINFSANFPQILKFPFNFS